MTGHPGSPLAPAGSAPDAPAGGAPCWITPQWPVPPTVRAVSTLRVGGVSEGPYASLNLGCHVEDHPAAVAENRRRLRVAAALPGEPEWLKQVHGIQVRDLDSPASAAPADAAVTRRPGRVCAILTADCLPVLLASAAGDRIGAAHAGWRGLAAGVIEAAVRAMDTPPGGLLAWLGPAIGPSTFEVGTEVRAQFLRASGSDGDEAAFVPNARGRYFADIYTLARSRLARAGVTRVYGGGACTHTESERYFSHRRDGRTGRQATLIWLEPTAHR